MLKLKSKVSGCQGLWFGAQVLLSRTGTTGGRGCWCGRQRPLLVEPVFSDRWVAFDLGSGQYPRTTRSNKLISTSMTALVSDPHMHTLFPQSPVCLVRRRAKAGKRKTRSKHHGGLPKQWMLSRPSQANESFPR